jgi:hypothetical protein
VGVDLLKTLALLGALLLRGVPDSWDHALQVRLYLSVDGSGGLEIAYDPVPIYFRALPGNLCGQFVGWVEVDPNAPIKGCRDTLAHELAHAWQFRSYGLLQPLTYGLSPGLWEPEVPASGVEGMPKPRHLNYALLKLWVPLWQLSP